MQLQPTSSTTSIRLALAMAILLILMDQNFLCRADKPIKTVENDGTEYEGLAYEVKHDDKTYVVAKFLGIPFADPPERFAKPTLKNPIPGRQDVKTLKPICQQIQDSTKFGCQEGNEMSEDCLYLNIYVPLPSIKTDDLLTPSPTPPTTTSTTTKTTPTTTHTPTKTTPTTTTTSTTTTTTTTTSTTTPTPNTLATTTTTTTSTAAPTTTTSTAASTATPLDTTPTTTPLDTTPTTTPLDTTPTTTPLDTTPTTTPLDTTPTTTPLDTTPTTTPLDTTPTTTPLDTTPTTTPLDTTPTTTPLDATPTTTTLDTTPRTTPTPSASSADEQAEEDSAEEAEVNVLTLPSANEKYAVLIYIHGGAYMKGASNCYDGSRLAGLGNIIVVTINYRLGPFGFLSTNDDVMPGNLGFWDQHVAIQWVSQNINRFGGDPGRITVGGQSAGSFSSIFQGLYKENDQLFHRIIAQSGTPSAFQSVSTSGYATTLNVANMLNCSIEGEGKSKEIKECLIETDAEALAEARPHVIVPGTLAIQPTLDAPFAAEDFYDMLSITPNFTDKEKTEVPEHFTNKDLLIGMNAQDGEVIYRVYLYDNPRDNVTIIDQETMVGLIKLRFQTDYQDEVDDILIEAILDRYIDWEDSDNLTTLSNRAVEFLTDIFWAIPSLDTATAHSIPNTAAARHTRSTQVAALRSSDRQKREASNANTDTVKQEGTNGQVKRASTYVYRFNVPAPSNVFSWFEGTPHSAEIPFMFEYFESNESPLNDEQRRLSEQIMTYWTNFVRTGNPNKAMLDDEATSSTPSRPSPLSLPEWEEYSNTDQKYLEIALSPGPETKSQLLADQRHFWSDYIPRLERRLAEKVNGTENKDGQDCPKQKNVGDSGSRLSSGYVALFSALLALIFL